MMDARRKASLLSFLHCLFIMVPITVLVQVSVSLASTFSAALGRSNSVWGLGDSSVTSMIVLPGLVLLLPLLFAPSLFFFLHHHHYHYQSSFDFLTTSTLERRGHPMKRNGSPASTTEHEEERGVISRRPRRLFFLPLSSWRTAVGAVVLAFLISYYCRRSPPSFSSSPKSLSSSSSDGAVELPQENAGANLLDSEKQEEDSQRGEKSFFSSMIGLDVSPLSSLQAFLEKKDLWWILERSFMPTFAERVGNSLFISSLSSIFHGYRPRASFPYSPERPLRLELRLFSRRYINGEVMREGESQGRWRIADDDMVGRNFIPSRGKKYKEDIGILIRGVSPPGRLLDPSSYTSPYVLEAIRRGVKTAMNRPSHSSTAEKREESEKTRLKAERERKEKGEKEQGEEPHEQRQSKEKRNLQKENDEESKSTVLSLKEDVMIVHFGEGSLETVRDRMMHLPQIPVAPPDSKGEALVAMIEVNSSLPTSSSSFHENKGDHSDSRREEKAERRNEDLRLEDKTSHTNHPGLALLPPHLPEQFLPDKNGNVSFPSSIFLHPTRAVFSSLYDSKTDQTRLQMRLGGSTLFSVLLPASPIAGWSLSHMTELQRIRNCDCIHLILFAPHPPAFVEFTLFLKGKSGVRSKGGIVQHARMHGP
ncbi:m28 family protein, partial [Cystoisospora suis]